MQFAARFENRMANRGEVTQYLRDVSANLRNLNGPLLECHAYMSKKTADRFRTLGSGGVDPESGLKWAPYSASTLGQLTPHSKRGAGVYEGRRPSGQPYTTASLLLQDTGRLMLTATTAVVNVSDSSLVFGTNLAYAALQQWGREYGPMPRRKLTPKQRRFLFASGILDSDGKAVVYNKLQGNGHPGRPFLYFTALDIETFQRIFVGMTLETR